MIRPAKREQLEVSPPQYLLDEIKRLTKLEKTSLKTLRKYIDDLPLETPPAIRDLLQPDAAREEFEFVTKARAQATGNLVHAPSLAANIPASATALPTRPSAANDIAAARTPNVSTTAEGSDVVEPPPKRYRHKTKKPPRLSSIETVIVLATTAAVAAVRTKTSDDTNEQLEPAKRSRCESDTRESPSKESRAGPPCQPVEAVRPSCTRWHHNCSSLPKPGHTPCPACSRTCHDNYLDELCDKNDSCGLCVAHGVYELPDSDLCIAQQFNTGCHTCHRFRCHRTSPTCGKCARHQHVCPSTPPPGQSPCPACARTCHDNYLDELCDKHDSCRLCVAYNIYELPDKDVCIAQQLTTGCHTCHRAGCYRTSPNCGKCIATNHICGDIDRTSRNNCHGCGRSCHRSSQDSLCELHGLPIPSCSHNLHYCVWSQNTSRDGCPACFRMCHNKYTDPTCRYRDSCPHCATHYLYRVPNRRQSGDNECRAFQLEHGCHQCGRANCHDTHANCTHRIVDTRTRPTCRPQQQCFINATITAVFSAAPIRAALDATLANMDLDLLKHLKAIIILISI